MSEITVFQGCLDDHFQLTVLAGRRRALARGPCRARCTGSCFCCCPSLASLSNPNVILFLRGRDFRSLHIFLPPACLSARSPTSARGLRGGSPPPPPAPSPRACHASSAPPGVVEFSFLPPLGFKGPLLSHFSKSFYVFNLI